MTTTQAQISQYGSPELQELIAAKLNVTLSPEQLFTHPAKPNSDHHRTLSKWLNEESTGPIDRIALAYVLGATAQAQPVGFVYGNSYWEANNLRISDDVRKYGEPRFAAPQPARMLTEADLPHHPEFNTMKWSELEKKVILEWVNSTLRKTP